MMESEVLRELGYKEDLKSIKDKILKCNDKSELSNFSDSVKKLGSETRKALKKKEFEKAHYLSIIIHKVLTLIFKGYATRGDTPFFENNDENISEEWWKNIAPFLICYEDFFNAFRNKKRCKKEIRSTC